jgi:hypothetical protein
MALSPPSPPPSATRLEQDCDYWTPPTLSPLVVLVNPSSMLVAGHVGHMVVGHVVGHVGRVVASVLVLVMSPMLVVGQSEQSGHSVVVEGHS